MWHCEPRNRRSRREIGHSCERNETRGDKRERERERDRERERERERDWTRNDRETGTAKEEKLGEKKVFGREGYSAGGGHV